MSFDSPALRPFRAPIVLIAGIALVLLGNAWVEERLNSKVDARAAIIATAVMGKMQEQLEAKVSEAANRGARDAVMAHVVPLEHRVARAEGWIESRQGRVEVSPR